MRKIRIYQANSFNPDDLYELSEEAGHHVGVVLRMQPGDTIVLFCGDNQEYQAHIERVHKKKVQVRIVDKMIVNKESPLSIHLVQAVSKGDRMEWVVQKAVELGVQYITPLISAHCVLKIEKIEKKWHQWQAIAISACEQCGRNQIPTIMQPIDFEEYIKNGSSAQKKLILHTQGGKSLSEYALESNNIEIMVGPEGGFNDQEVQASIKAGFLPWKLGPRILRTETAAIVGLSLLQAARGDL